MLWHPAWLPCLEQKDIVFTLLKSAKESHCASDCIRTFSDKVSGLSKVLRAASTLAGLIGKNPLSYLCQKAITEFLFGFNNVQI